MKLYVWNKENLAIKDIQVVVIANSLNNAIAQVRTNNPQIYCEIQKFKNFDNLPTEAMLKIQNNPNKTIKEKTAEIVDLLDATYLTEKGFTTKAILPKQYELDQELIFINV